MTRRTVPLLAAALLAAVVTAAPWTASGSPAVTEFSSGITAGSSPHDIAAGPDGALWFTEYSKPGRIGRISTTGAVTEFSSGISTTGWPTEIALGPDGNMWFTEWGDRIGRISPSGVVTEFSAGISPGSHPLGIAAGPDGNMWFTEPMANAIGRISPSGVVTEFSAGISNGAQPQRIAAGPDGNMWFTQRAGRIGRITPSGVVTEFSSGISGSGYPFDIVAGPDGNMWFTQASRDRLARITPAGVVREFSDGITLGAQPMGIAVGPDSAIWFVEQSGNRVGRLALGAGPAVLAPTRVGPRSATLNGTVPGDGERFTWRFDYGTTTAYGRSTPEGSSGASATPVSVSAGVSGLEPQTTYHVRLVVTTDSGSRASSDVTFTTPPLSSPSSPSGPSSAPRPALGRAVVIQVVQGTVTVRRPGVARAVPLSTRTAIPVGSVIDATRGRVTLTTSLEDGRLQTGRFWGGAFRVRQPRSAGGMTDILLAGRRPSCPAAPRPGTARENARRPRVRSLWASDHKGRFRTHGRDSVATVRGTLWLTVERCDGTLTRVFRGAVAVRDKRLRRTVVIRAGGRYLARRSG